jgi:4-amino-4-deoxychorismate lyase
MYWVNGKLSETISVKDRSFQYGDGAFTTMLTNSGQIQLWEYHRQRMDACLRALSIPKPDWLLVEAWLQQAVKHNPKAGLKLLVSRGVGGRGYGIEGATHPTIVISHFDYPEHYSQWQQSGIALGVSSVRLGINPRLAGHKHNNRLEQILIKREIEQESWQDAVVLDIDDNVIETSIANLFWCKSGKLFTPNLDKCGITGVMRKQVIQFAENRNIEVQTSEYSVAELVDAKEVFMTNSLLGIVPITQINLNINKSPIEFEIGAITRNFQEKLNRA